MAGSKESMDQPENLNQLLKQEKRDYDCTPCRIVGMFYPSCSLPATLYQGFH